MTGETLSLERQRSLRLTDHEVEVIDAVARAEGMTFSQFVRRTLRRAVNLPLDGSLPPVLGENVTPSNGAAIGEHPNNGGAS